MSQFSDSRSALIEALRTNNEDFILSNSVLPKSKSLKVIVFLFRLRDDMLNFAVDPDAAPGLPVPPPEPHTEGMDEQEQAKRWQEYRETFMYWLAIKDAHNRKVSLDKYLEIEDYFIPFFKTITTTSAVKGLRFKAFTKTIPDQKPQGLLGKLMGGSGDE